MSKTRKRGQKTDSGGRVFGILLYVSLTILAIKFIFSTLELVLLHGGA